MLMTGDIERLLAVERPPVDRRRRRGDPGHRPRPGRAPRRGAPRAARACARRRASRVPAWTDYLLAWLDRRARGHAAAASTALSALKIMDDPEAHLPGGLAALRRRRARARARATCARAVAKGYFVAPTLAGSPQFDALRSDPAFQELLADAEAGRQQALAAFREAGGAMLVGFWPARLGQLDDLLKKLQDEESGGPRP